MRRTAPTTAKKNIAGDRVWRGCAPSATGYTPRVIDSGSTGQNANGRDCAAPGGGNSAGQAWVLARDLVASAPGRCALAGLLLHTAGVTEAFGLLVIVPLLREPALLEFVLGLPGEQFRRGRSSRRIMRRALCSVLPPTVLEHSDKTHPARVRPWRTAMDGAVPTVLRRLDARAEPPARAGYLDMDRLRAHLEARLDGKPAQPGKLTRALKFLDWDSG